MSKHYWICNIHPRYWSSCRDDLTWGVPNPNNNNRPYGINQLERVRIGDVLLFYVQGQGISGYFSASSRAHEDDKPQWKGFLNRVRIEETKMLSSPIPFWAFSGKIYNQQTAKPIDNGAAIFGKSMIPISSEDFEYLLNLSI